MRATPAQGTPRVHAARRQQIGTQRARRTLRLAQHGQQFRRLQPGPAGGERMGSQQHNIRRRLDPMGPGQRARPGDETVGRRPADLGQAARRLAFDQIEDGIGQGGLDQTVHIGLGQDQRLRGIRRGFRARLRQPEGLERAGPAHVAPVHQRRGQPRPCGGVQGPGQRREHARVGKPQQMACALGRHHRLQTGLPQVHQLVGGFPRGQETQHGPPLAVRAERRHHGAQTGAGAVVQRHQVRRRRQQVVQRAGPPIERHIRAGRDERLAAQIESPIDQGEPMDLRRTENGLQQAIQPGRWIMGFDSKIHGDTRSIMLTRRKAGTLRTALRERHSRCMSLKSVAACPDSRGA